MPATIIGMDYALVDDTRQTLAQGSQDLQDRLNQLAREMMAMDDGRGNWIQAFTAVKQNWDRQMAQMAQVLNTTAAQLKISAVAMQAADQASARGFNNIAV